MGKQKLEKKRKYTCEICNTKVDDFDIAFLEVHHSKHPKQAVRLGMLTPNALPRRYLRGFLFAVEITAAPWLVVRGYIICVFSCAEFVL